MTVKLVPYDANWPQQYEAERCFILEAVGKKILSIDHIGSTSVPGLGAKAIIDTIVGVADKKTSDEILEAISPSDISALAGERTLTGSTALAVSLEKFAFTCIWSSMIAIFI